MAGMRRPLIAAALGFAALPYLILGSATIFDPPDPADSDVPAWVAYVWAAEALVVGGLLALAAWLALNGIARWGRVAVAAAALMPVVLLTVGLFGLVHVAGLAVLVIVALALRTRTSADTA